MLPRKLFSPRDGAHTRQEVPMLPTHARLVDTMHDLVRLEFIRARHANGWSIRDVAAALGVSHALISQVEIGRCNPSIGLLRQLSSHLDVSLDALLARAAEARNAA
jgi:ribosome-binding protein aMBF1 (putative translation factor)